MVSTSHLFSLGNVYCRLRNRSGPMRSTNSTMAMSSIRWSQCEKVEEGNAQLPPIVQDIVHII
jgi:hypothetical protein